LFSADWSCVEPWSSSTDWLEWFTFVALESAPELFD
jgi:hypothetical protein